MRRSFVLVLAAALIGAACGTSQETAIPTNDGSAATTADLQPTESVTTATEQAADEETTVVDEPPDTLFPDTSWEDQPLARVILTEADLPSLGLEDGWVVERINYFEIDPANTRPDGTEEQNTLCGTPSPDQTSFYDAVFSNDEMNRQLNLLVMPQADGFSSPTDFVNFIEVLATCKDRPGLWASMSSDLVDVEIAGSTDSAVSMGTDSLPQGVVGISRAAAVADDHLFLVTVMHRDSSSPYEGDVDLAVRTAELSISRL